MPIKNAVWLQCGACGGCSLSMIGYEGANIMDALSDAHIKFLWQPTFSQNDSRSVLDLFEQIIKGTTDLEFLIVEGTPYAGPNGSGLFQTFGGSDMPMIQWVEQLAAKASYTLAIGSCSSFGGIPSSGDERLEPTGLQFDGLEKGGLLGKDYLSKKGFPVINIPGCPPHPDWIVETLWSLAEDKYQPGELDHEGRPLAYFNHLAHHGCPRNEFYEFKASAIHDDDLGCLMENLGCKGTQALGDCNVRPWNGTGSCLQGGYACIACTMPEFEKKQGSFFKTEKVAGIPVGLPSDMPKAWFVALAALSKSATPERLRENAKQSRLTYQPTRKKAGN